MGNDQNQQGNKPGQEQKPGQGGQQKPDQK